MDSSFRMLCEYKLVQQNASSLILNIILETGQKVASPEALNTEVRKLVIA